VNRTALRAGFVLADAIGSSWGDAAVHFTCSEADGIALALRLLGQRATAARVVMGHARNEDEDEGDAHYRLAFDGGGNLRPPLEVAALVNEYVDQLDSADPLETQP